MDLTHFMLTYAPPLTLFLCVFIVFFWGAKAKPVFTEEGEHEKTGRKSGKAKK
ncbi:hypothetical protein MM300_11805 [Evansella sp. LMS18]|jgi:hypothetical protein|uniref:cytochrome bd oxidase small subunit CydS n=1 Tax=Evansella sp. LMS18 TaxID=2924033 RepID=UPI0020D1D1E6|nr:hypothetical protein [Evansella sp. LMS18]UTR08645.1 hypothetical protein MM300_11805 [Evansella sp. LMS18]